MSKKYKENRSEALEQLINKQQSDIQYWQNIVENKDFIIEAQGRENDQHILMCKFLVDVLILLSTLDSVMTENTVFVNAVKIAIAKFKMELSKAMQIIQYDGGNSFTYAPVTNNTDNDEEYE